MGPRPRGGREGSTWKSLSSLKRENLSAISRRPGPAPLRPPPPPPPSAPPACTAPAGTAHAPPHWSRAQQRESRDRQRRPSLTAAPTRGVERLLQRDGGGRTGPETAAHRGSAQQGGEAGSHGWPRPQRSAAAGHVPPSLAARLTADGSAHARLGGQWGREPRHTRAGQPIRARMAHARA